MRRSRAVRGVALLAATLVLAGCVTNRAAPPGATDPAVATVAIGVDLPFSGPVLDASMDTMRAASRSPRSGPSSGNNVSIDPETGDTNVNDVTVLLVKDGKETLVKAVTT